MLICNFENYTLHLDSKMKSNLDSMKAKERRDEILRTYQNMGRFI